MRRLYVTLAMAAACLLLGCGGEPVAAQLAWQRDAILHGEAWRLWTGHLVHFSASHAGADALALLAMGALAEAAAGSRRFALLLVRGTLLVSLGLLLAVPALAEYRGASALATLAAALAGVLAWRNHPHLRPLLASAALALAGKTLWEAGGQAVALAGVPGGVVVAWQAHLLGALAGSCAAPYRRDECSRLT